MGKIEFYNEREDWTMSDDKEKKVQIDGMDKVDKDAKKDEDGEEDLDAIFGDDADSVRLSKSNIEISKNQLKDALPDDGELEDDDD